MIQCKCPSCSKAYKVRDELAGRSAKCACGNRFIIPAPTPDPAAPAPIEASTTPAAVPAPDLHKAEPAPAPPVPPEPVAEPTPAAPTAPPRPVGIIPQAASAPVSVPTAAPQRTDEPDEGAGGAGRLIFISALAGVTLVAVVLGMMARHRPGMVRIVAAAWIVVAAIVMFIVTQMRLVNIGYNEWLSLVWPGLIGGCAVFPEGFGSKAKTGSTGKSNSGALVGAAIAVTVLFYAAAGVFAWWLRYRY